MGKKKTGEGDFDLGNSLGKIESKIDAMNTNISKEINHLNDTVTKVILALIGVIGADVGVNFIPHSPIDWVGAIEYTTRFLTILTFIFVTFALLLAYKKDKKIYINNYFTFGFILVLFAFVWNFFIDFDSDEFVLAIIRVLYCVSFVIFAWKATFNKKNEVCVESNKAVKKWYKIGK